MPQAGPAPYRQPAVIDNQGSARQQGAAGAALQDTGAQLTQEEVNAQGLANQVMVDDGMNKAITEKQRLTYDPDGGFANVKGEAAFRPDPLGRPLAQRYTEQLQDKINEISASLGNDAQRRVFNQQAAAMLTQFGGDVQRYSLSEGRDYNNKAQQATIDLATDQAKQNWSDPDRVSQQLLSATGAVWKLGQLNGMPGNEVEAKLKDTTSAIHTGVIAAALQNNNPTYAQRYLEANKGTMTADDILKVTGLVNHSVDGQAALGAVRTATANLSAQIQPTDMDRLTNIVRGMESGGRETNADGSMLTSSKGAKGSMQVMDATAADPGFGVAPPKDNSPAALAEFGRRYLGGLVAHYGDPAQAMAAYNAGPGKLDDAIAAAKKAGAPQNWLSYLPQETQAYVQKGMAKYGAGGGVQAFPTESQFVQTALAALGDNPRIEQVQLTRQQATAEYAMLDKSRKEQGDQATQVAQQWLANNKGNLAAMPPEIKAAVIRYAPDKYDNLPDYAAKIANPVRIDNLAAYNQAAGHPEALAKMPDTEFEDFITNNFTQSTARALVKERQDQLDGTNDLSAQGINRPAVNRALNNAMVALGIPISASKGQPFGQAEQERVGGIRAYVDQSIFDAQKQIGQKMTAEQVQQHISKLFTTDVSFKNTLWYGGHENTSQKLMAMQLTDLPTGAAEGIRQSLIAAGNKAPTNTDILNQYRRLHAK